MRPAQQGFDAENPARRQFDARLVVEGQFVAVDGFAQGALERQELDRLVVQLLGEEDKLVAKAANTGEYLHSRLLSIAEKYSVVSNVRAKGLIAAFDFPDKNTRDLFIKKGLEKNVMFLGCGNKSIRFRPALIMEEADLDLGLTVLEDVVKTL
jgi:4-aminobutyrate aminotransferase-like enzyme